MDLNERSLARLRLSLVEESYDSGDVEQLLSWIRQAQATKPVLFAGAGVSLGARALGGGPPEKLPALWWELEAAMRRELGEIAPQKGSNPLWLAQVFENALGSQALKNLLRREVPDERLEPGPIHDALARIPWHAIITTNYDSLLERSFDRTAVSVVTSDRQLASSRKTGSLEILHPHGSFADDADLVFTLESYRRFEKTRPGMLAKIKQLLLQHPVLFVGFGAEDPNFIQWAGWVQDITRGASPLWLNLDVSDSRRDQYVSQIFPGVRFFHVPVSDASDRLERLATSIAGALGPQSGHWVTTLEEELRRASSIAEAMDILELAHRLKQRDPTDGMWGTGQLFRLALESILRLSTVPGSATLQEAFATHECAPLDKDQLAIVKHAFGDTWTRFLEICVQYDGPTVRCMPLRLPTATDPELMENRFVSASQTLELLEQGKFDGSLKVDLTEEPSSQFQRRVNSRVRMHLLRRGQRIEPVIHPRSAHEHRYVGFLAALDDDSAASARAYEHALWASKAEGEPPWLQYQTALSLWGQADPRVEEHRRSLSLSDEVRAWTTRLNTALLRTIKAFQDIQIEGVVRFGPQNLPAIPFVDVMEEEWILPALIAQLAVPTAQLMILGPNARRGIEFLTFYGDKTGLKENLRRLIRLGGVRGLDRGVIDELLSASASFSEKRAKAAGLTEVVSELLGVNQALRFAIDGITNPPEGQGWNATSEFKKLLENLLICYGKEIASPAVLSLLEPSERQSWGIDLPWSKWLREKTVSVSDVEVWWTDTPDKYRGRFLDIALGAHKDGIQSAILRGALEELADQPPVLDECSWVRAAAVEALRDKATHEKHLRDLCSRAETSDQANMALQALAEHPAFITAKLVQRSKTALSIHRLGKERIPTWWTSDEFEGHLSVIQSVWRAEDINLTNTLFRWADKWGALRVLMANHGFAKQPRLRELTEERLSGLTKEQDASQQQLLGLNAVLWHQQADPKSTWWFANTLMLCASHNPDIAMGALRVLSTEQAVSSLSKAGLEPTVEDAFRRAALDGRALVRREIVLAALRWKSILGEPSWWENVKHDPRAFVRSAFSEQKCGEEE